MVPTRRNFLQTAALGAVSTTLSCNTASESTNGANRGLSARDLEDRFDPWIEVEAENSAPTVDVGPDLDVNLPSNATLDATVSDDGEPDPPGSVTTTWTKQSGPGTVTFGNASAVDTTAAFSTSGTYVLRLTADDDALTD